jgi:hypothetical protein
VIEPPAADLAHAAAPPLQGAIYAGALSLLGLQMGTYQKYPFWGYSIEPGFAASPPDVSARLARVAWPARATSFFFLSSRSRRLD